MRKAFDFIFPGELGAADCVAFVHVTTTSTTFESAFAGHAT
jgi:hypothetical protein